MPALPESLFDVFYLIFMTISSIRLLKKSSGNTVTRLWGWMCLILVFGDAFHLVPRIFRYWFPGGFTTALGVGKLVTSITMALYYLLLEYSREKRYPEEKSLRPLMIAWLLTVVRIVLCLLPQNRWISTDPPIVWGIVRNIPFTILGILTVIWWFRSARNDKPLALMWLAVALSFAFYLPVVLFASTAPITGMLMLPKTCMYIWIALMFQKGAANLARNECPSAAA